MVADCVRYQLPDERTLKMDDAALTIRQYVAALSRLFRGFSLDSMKSESGGCDGCRVGIR